MCNKIIREKQCNEWTFFSAGASVTPSLLIHTPSSQLPPIELITGVAPPPTPGEGSGGVGSGALSVSGGGGEKAFWAINEQKTGARGRRRKTNKNILRSKSGGGCFLYIKLVSLHRKLICPA